MVFHDIGKQLEPEAGKLREHLTFIGDIVFEDIVECRNAIGCNEQEFVAQIVEIAHFTLSIGLDIDSLHVDPF